MLLTMGRLLAAAAVPGAEIRGAVYAVASAVPPLPSSWSLYWSS
jgi:hypothetical protein